MRRSLAAIPCNVNMFLQNVFFKINLGYYLMNSRVNLAILHINPFRHVFGKHIKHLSIIHNLLGV